MPSKKKAPPPTKTMQVNSEDSDNKLWRGIVTGNPDIFDTHILPKLNGNDVKFFYDVNRESRAAIKRAGVRLPDTFKIRDFDTKSTISWALEMCSEEQKKRFCSKMAEKGNLEYASIFARKRMSLMKRLVLELPNMVTSSV